MATRSATQSIVAIRTKAPDRIGRSRWRSVVLVVGLSIVLAACSRSSQRDQAGTVDAGGGTAGTAPPAASSIPPSSARRSVPLSPLSTHVSAADAPSADNVTAEFRAEWHRLEALIEEEPADTVSLLALAHLLHDAHLEDDAVQHYREYTRQHPKNRQAWLDLASVQAAGGDWAAALEATELLLQYYPDDPSGLYNLGAILANRGDRQKAEELWRQVAQQRSDTAIANKAVESLERLKSF